MSVREKGYHKWEGELVSKPIQWLPVFRFSIRQIYNKRFAKALFAVELIPFLVFLFFSYILYVVNQPNSNLLSFLREIPSEVKTLDYFFFTFFCFGPTVFFQYILLSIFCGSELVSSDLRSHSFSLYFSKPISVRDYLFGKYFSLLFFLLLFSLVPGLVLLLIKIALSGLDGIGMRLVLGIVFYPLIVGSMMSFFTLWISSLSQNSRWVKVLYFMFFFGLSAFSGILVGLSGGDKRYLLADINTNIIQSGHFFFSVKSNLSTAPWISVLIMIILTFLFFFLVVRKISKIEA